MLNALRYQLLLLTLTLFCFQTLACRSASGQQQWPKLTISKPIEWSAELLANLPFDGSKYKNLNEADNREQGYFRIFAKLYISPNGRSSFSDASTGRTLGLREMPKKLRRTAIQGRIARERFEELFDKHGEDLARLCRDETQAKDIRKVVKKFDWVFEEIAELQASRKSCVLLNRVSRNSIREFETELKLIVELASVRYLLSPESEKGLDELNIVLDMLLDFHYWRTESTSLRKIDIQSICYQGIVKLMLEGEQSLEHLDHLIVILKKHVSALERTNPALEYVKLDYLRRKSSYLRLRSLLNRSAEPSSVRKELDDLGVTNGQGSDYVTRFWLNSTRSAAEKAFAEESYLKRQKDLGLNQKKAFGWQWNRFIDARIRELTVADLNRDLGLLDLRYDEIVKACALPFPDSEKSLDELRERWNVTDQTWLASSLLLCQSPPLIPYQSERLVDARAFLCIAALKRWQMEHDGERPKSLPDAVKEIGLKEVPIDPWSGEGLLFANDHNVLVYSVGPDGIDQKGARLERRKRREKNSRRLSLEKHKRKGDISFEIFWQQ